MSRAVYRDSSVAIFVATAREFCAFMEDAAKLAIDERMSAARRQILAVYTAALSLPLLEPADAEPAGSPSAPSEWRGFEDYDTYWEVFDPYEPGEPVAGSLSDDLLDVYRDVRRGLALWESEHHVEAIWEWRFSFQSHWGDHAVDALRALHRSCARVAR